LLPVTSQDCARSFASFAANDFSQRAATRCCGPVAASYGYDHNCLVYRAVKTC
jgi:hypothetical protein